ncbi:MAG: M3 family metallopeptidase [Patescibacteria group bacterium]
MKTLIATPKDFAWTRWTPKDIRHVADSCIARKKNRYTEIKKISNTARTFENTVLALERSDYDISDDMARIDVLMNVSTKKDVRESAKETVEFVAKKMLDIEYDEKIYSALKAYAARKERLMGPDKKLFVDMMRGYRRMGFDLPKGKRNTLKKNLKELSRLEISFSHNINQYRDHILVSREELAGLSPRYIGGLGKDQKTAKYKVTLDYPDIGPFMAKAKNAEKRRELAEKNLEKGGAKNRALLNRVLKIRRLNAKLLGYKTHADYKMEVRTVKTTRRAMRFVNGLLRKTHKGLLKDIADLEREKARGAVGKDTRMKFYDVAYYSDQILQKKFKLDSEKVREYFPLEKVLDGTFAIYEKLFSVRFEKVGGFSLWHRDVRMFAVKEKGHTIANIALDLYPREGKYTHACAIQLRGGRKVPNEDAYVAPIGVMLANFPKPNTAYQSLLSHGEAETFFHEFGHIMHVVLTKAEYASQAGYHTAWDFVEAPSQMLEHWVWDEKMLRKLSGHYKTNAPFPRAMMRALLAAKDHMVCYDTVRQLVLGFFDLTLHTKRITRPETVYADLVKKYIGISLPKRQIFPAGFGHLMGYDAGYYGYLWSKVFATDMFTRFKREGLLNVRTGMAYRQCILEKGSSEDEVKLVERFLERKVNDRAFLREIGLKGK